MGNDLKQKILVQNGIISEADVPKPAPTVADCARCQLVNPLENKYCSSCGYPLSVAAYEELKAADNEELNKVKKHLQELESDRITKEDLDELRRQWMIELQKQRALISLSEWNALKKEMYEIYEMLDRHNNKTKTHSLITDN